MSVNPRLPRRVEYSLTGSVLDCMRSILDRAHDSIDRRHCPAHHLGRLPRLMACGVGAAHEHRLSAWPGGRAALHTFHSTIFCLLHRRTTGMYNIHTSYMHTYIHTYMKTCMMYYWLATPTTVLSSGLNFNNLHLSAIFIY